MYEDVRQDPRFSVESLDNNVHRIVHLFQLLIIRLLSSFLREHVLFFDDIYSDNIIQDNIHQYPNKQDHHETI